MRESLYIFVWICCTPFYGNTTESVGRLFSDKSTSLETDSIVDNYMDKAYYFLISYELDSAKLYLDSISLYEKQLTDPLILGLYYSYYGAYYSFRQQEAEAHRYYYKAIEYYEKTKEITTLVSIYHNLAISYIHRKDTDQLKKIIDRMTLLASSDKNITQLIQTYHIISFYYGCMYEKDLKQVAFLDSAIYYDKQVISHYEANKDLALRNEEISYNYIHFIASSLKKGTFDLDTLSSYLSIADNLISEHDTAMQINRLWIDGEMQFHKKDYMGAKQSFTEQMALMDVWSPQKDLSIYLDVCDRLAEIAEMQSDYKTALYYQRKKTDCLAQIHDAHRYEIIQELGTKYEVRQKEQAIAYLTESNNFRKMINYLSLFFFLSAVTALFFVVRWLTQKRKTAAAQLKLTRIEKDNALLQVRLKEKELNETISEKCVALVDNYFKDEQIAEMDQELQALREDQQRLNIRIRKYVEEHEKRQTQGIVFATQDTYYTSLIREVYELIGKRIGDNIPEKKEYIDSLAHIGDPFFFALKEKAPEELSALNMKYCLCFYIDMKTEHIAQCFSVEPPSVRMARHRLKVGLKVEKEMDISTYLKLMVD